MSMGRGYAMEYLTTTEAAKVIGIPTRTLLNRIKAGIIQAERAGPRAWLVPRTEVEKWRNRGRLRPWEGRRIREQLS